jgi:hypothetical protein
MFQDRKGGLGAIEQRMAWTIEVRVLQRIEHAAVGCRNERRHDVARRPR